MKYIKTVAIALTLVTIISCKNKEKEVVDETEVEEVEQKSTSEKILTINLSPKSESEVEGTVTFLEKDGNVTLTAKMSGLTEGVHAIHIHETADCSSTDGKSAGGHWNPTAQPHGKWGATTGYHKGDIGNFSVGEDGIGTVTMTTDQWCLDCEDSTKNVIGKAIIVHQGTDDFTSQPSGAAGSRVSCGGIIK